MKACGFGADPEVGFFVFEEGEDGVGADGWRSDKPKVKFVMINLPFKTVTVKRLTLKKKTVLGIYMEERGEGEQTSSVLYWDGKKYRYQQMGATLD